MITFSNVHRSYRIPLLEPGWKGVFQNLFFPVHKEKMAVNGINFSLKPGEAVGYVGANGAGKSTTIKLILGILQPEAGTIRVMGMPPAPLPDRLKRRIGVVFGQRSQLWWNLPVQDSLELFGKMYLVPSDLFRKNMSELVERLDIGRLLKQSARQLSLGERMRCDLAIACIHNPDLLVLDEPTIGLDMASRFRLREFLKERNRTAGTTIFLTTHDLGDIQEVCGRIILIDHGKILADDSLPALCRRLGNEPCLQFVFSESLTPETIQSMEDFLSRSYTGPWTLETSGDFSVTIRLPNGKNFQIERIQRAFLDRFRISTCTFSDALPLERILRQIGAKPHASHGVSEIGPGEDILRKARKIRRRSSVDAPMNLLELAEKTSQQSERLSILLLLRGLEDNQNRNPVFRKLLDLATKCQDSQSLATLIRLLGLFGTRNEPEIREFLSRQIFHADERVRANAVEAWGALDFPDDSPEINRLAGDESPRVLANVAVLNLQHSNLDGLRTLRLMLEKPKSAESAAFALRLFFEARPLERWLFQNSNNNIEGLNFLTDLFALEDNLVNSLKLGGVVRQRALALAAFPYTRGIAGLFESCKNSPDSFPEVELKSLIGIEFK